MDEENVSILVVDDTETTRNLLVGILSQKGYRVSFAWSGKQALELLTKQRFNLILLDIVMPELDGYAVLKEIRHTHAASELPVIVVTIKHGSDDIVKALTLGANDYVAKPIDVPVLFARIQTLLMYQESEFDLKRTKAELERRVRLRTFELSNLNLGLQQQIAHGKKIETNLRNEIKQRRDVEESLRRSERRYRELYEHLPSMFFTLDRRGRIRSVNEFGARQLGYTADELRGKPFFVLHDPIMHDAVRDFLECSFETDGTVYRWENRKRHKDGDTLWVRDTARVVTNIDGHTNLFIICEDITEAQILSEKLSYQATHDDLTGLVNRREFKKRLQRILDTAKTEHSRHALCYLDLDEFKVINDTCGHSAGDELLRQLGSLLMSQARKRDTLARLGGDEFGILMEHCSIHQATRLANTIREQIKDFRFYWENQQFGIGASIGLVAIDETSDSLSSVLRAADGACYLAKKGGRNRIHAYRKDEDTLSDARAVTQWGLRIDRALEERRFELFYQSIDTLTGHQHHGSCFELLLRMKDQEGKLLLPAAFLTAAQRLNRLIRLDRWVIANTFDWLSNHPRQLNNLNLCSINLSPHSIVDKEFIAYIIAQIDAYDIPPEKICFEITENAATANLSSTKRLINTLNEVGCSFALDDFGNGLTSFDFFRNIPVDYLKIGGELIKGLLRDKLSLSIVKSINEISHMMGTKTIAETVQDRDTLLTVKEIGFDFAQGYCINYPQPIDVLAEENTWD